jgi:hypothetical protein
MAMLPRDQIPTVITHNFDPLRGPFRNICNLPEAEAQKILDEISAAGKRRIREKYLRRRMRTETWLLAERKKKLGSPRMERPIYFFLGNMADGADASRPWPVVIPLTAFPADVLTFTYPDSMSSFPIGTREDNANLSQTVSWAGLHSRGNQVCHLRIRNAGRKMEIRGNDEIRKVRRGSGLG